MANLLRKVLTVLEIIKFFEIKNQTQVYIAALFKCNKATISKIIANKDYWKNQAEKFESYENLRPSKFDALEQALFSGLYKGELTEEIFQVLGGRKLAQIAKIENFKASESWFSRFKHDFDLKFVKKLHGENGSFDENYYTESLKSLRRQLSGIHPDNIYNIDESGLCYECTPNFIYILP